jgi:hypothetical protein
MAVLGLAPSISHGHLRLPSFRYTSSKAWMRGPSPRRTIEGCDLVSFATIFGHGFSFAKAYLLAKVADLNDTKMALGLAHETHRMA